MSDTKLKKYQKRAFRDAGTQLHQFPMYGWFTEGGYSVIKCLKCGKELRVDIRTGRADGDALQEKCG